MNIVAGKDLTIEDVRLYFHKTLVQVRKVTESNQTADWMYVTGEEEDSFKAKGSNGKVTTYRKGDLKTLEFLVDYPVGYFNTKHSCVFMRRLPSRVAVKGLHPHNYQIMSIESIIGQRIDFSSRLDLSAHQGLIVKNNIVPGNHVPEFYQWLFSEQKQVPFTKALKEVRTFKSFGRALSRRFAVACDALSPHLQVWYQTMPVATLNKADILTITEPLFKQECEDFFLPKGILIE